MTIQQWQVLRRLARDAQPTSRHDRGSARHRHAEEVFYLALLAVLLPPDRTLH